MRSAAVSVVRRDPHRETTALATGGIRRFEAFADDERWVGYATTTPDAWSGWHHHGRHDTFFYLIKGTIELEYGEGGRERVAAESGDFVHVPAGLVHREGTPPGDPAEAVVVRVGQGPTVVNVDGPGG